MADSAPRRLPAGIHHPRTPGVIRKGIPAKGFTRAQLRALKKRAGK